MCPSLAILAGSFPADLLALSRPPIGTPLAVGGMAGWLTRPAFRPREERERSWVRAPAAVVFIIGCTLFAMNGVQPSPALPAWSAGAAICSAAVARARLPDTTSLIASQQRRTPMKPASCFILLLCLLSGDVQTNPGPALRVFQQNVNSIKGKLGTMRSHTGELSDYHAICLTETKLGDSVGDLELQLGFTDFTWFRRDRNENGGGVACGVRTALSPVRRLDMETDCECLVIQIGTARPAFLAVCYRPPANDGSLREVADMLRGLHRSGRPFLAVGDFNLPEISWDQDKEPALKRHSARATNFIDALAECDAHQSVFSATRGENILDLAIASGGAAVSEVRDKLFDSDHLVVETFFAVNTGAAPRATRSTVYSYKRADFAGLKQALRLLPWDLMQCLDVDAAVTLFYDFAFAAINDHVPMVTLRKTFPPWFDRTVRELLRAKERAFRRKKANPTPENVALHAQARTDFKRRTAKSYHDYLLGLVHEFKENSKRFWSFIRSLKSCGKASPVLECNGVVVKDAEERANCFNVTFSKKFSDPRVDVYPEAHQLGAPGLSEFSVPDGRVAQLLRELSAHKACGPDGLSARILRECADEFAVPLDIICRMSLTSGVFPTVWKRAHVIPVHKKGSKKLPENYRPVSLLSICSKILEKVVCESLLLACLPALPQSQHGFIPRRSCISNLACFMDHCQRSFSEGLQTDTIYTDFSSAFTSVNHRLLLYKLRYSFNITGLALGWIESYLGQRSQRVILDGKHSDWLPVLSGVPEGSILGPMLFNCYVADIPEIIKNGCLAYADDVKIFHRIKTQADTVSLQADLDRLCEWSKFWRLKLNPAKCKVITFTLRKSPVISSYILDSHQLERCEQIRDLGVILDEKLTFAHHVDDVVRKANRMLGLLIRSMQTAPCMRGAGFDHRPVMTAFAAHVRSVIDYASVIWSGAAGTHLARLERLNHRFLMWLAAKTQRRCPSLDYDSLLDHFKCQSIKARMTQADITFMRSVFSGRIDCNELVAKFSLATQVRRSRHTGLFHVPFGRVNSVQRGLFIRLPRLMNRLLHDHPEADLFQPPRGWRSLVLRFAAGQGTFSDRS